MQRSHFFAALAVLCLLGTSGAAAAVLQPAKQCQWAGSFCDLSSGLQRGRGAVAFGGIPFAPQACSNSTRNPLYP